jgi:hypothetical protein
MNRQMARCRLIFLLGLGLSATFASSTLAQQTAKTTSVNTELGESGKHIFGIIPNYRTSPSLKDYKPLAGREKFKIARQDSFDQGTVALAAVSAGLGQLNNTNSSFGRGVEGYSHRLVTSYADYVIGDFMTEAIYPALLHQDPRYFRRGHGSSLSRAGYAFAQLVMTHGDSGRRQFNFSEVLGNSTAVAISTSYYPDNRTATDAVASLGTQLLVDGLSNTLKEFWPDINRKFLRRRHPSE